MGAAPAGVGGGRRHRVESKVGAAAAAAPRCGHTQLSSHTSSFPACERQIRDRRCECGECGGWWQRWWQRWWRQRAGCPRAFSGAVSVQCIGRCIELRVFFLCIDCHSNHWLCRGSSQRAASGCRGVYGHCVARCHSGCNCLCCPSAGAHVSGSTCACSSWGTCGALCTQLARASGCTRGCACLWGIGSAGCACRLCHCV